MDTSEVYAKMCERATELQPHKIKNGDFYFKKLRPEDCGSYYISYTSEYDDYVVEHPEQWDYLHNIIIWLPRQDQLQEMFHSSNLKELLHNFTVFIDSIIGYCKTYSCKFNSMEQLWLAFFMKSHNKMWIDESWEVSPLQFNYNCFMADYARIDSVCDGCIQSKYFNLK